MSTPALKYGAFREDGFRFLCIQKKTGTAHWLSPESWDRRMATQRSYQKRNVGRGTALKREARRKNPQPSREYKRRQYWSQPDKMRADMRERRHTPEHRAWVSHYRERNRTRIAEWHKQYQRINPAYFREASASRRALIAGGVKTLSEEQRKLILRVYEQAQRVSKCIGTPFHVDHIDPLNPRMRGVEGFHKPDNLQILPAKLNLIKSNRGRGEFTNPLYV